VGKGVRAANINMTAVTNDTISTFTVINDSVSVTLSPANDSNKLVINKTLLVYPSTTLDVGSSIVLTGFGSTAGSGLLRTASANTTPLPATLNWGMTVEFYRTGIQYIPNGNYNGLIIDSGTNIIIPSSITVTGSSFNNNGIVTGAGAVRLVGTSLQHISGMGTVNKLTLYNKAGAVIDSGNNQLNVKGVITLQSGQLTTNGNLVMKSDNTATASLAALSPNGNIGSISGNVTVERYIPTKTARNYSFVTSPVVQSIRNAWQQQIYVTGAGSGGTVCGTTFGDGVVSTDKYNNNGFDVTPSNNANIFTYNATIVNGSRWVSIPNTENTKFTPGIGYKVNIMGDRNNVGVSCFNQLDSLIPSAPVAVVLSATGTLDTGNKSVALNNITQNKYNLLGNPYPTPISFAAFQTANAGKINNKMWTYSPYSQTAGNYTTCLNGVYANQASGYDGTSGDYLSSGQAFFVEANNQGNVLFTESQKITATPPNNQYFGTTTPKLIRVGLTTSSNYRLDEVVILFNTNGSKVYVPANDAISFDNGNQVLVAIKDTNYLAITTRPDNLLADTINIGISSTAVGAYMLKFSGYTAIDTARKITLIDNFLGVTQNMRLNQYYNFNITSDTTSKGNNRFQIVLGAGNPLPIKSINVTATVENGKVNVAWNTLGESQVAHYEVEKSVDGIYFSTIGQVAAKNMAIANYTFMDNNAIDCYYRIKAVNADGSVSYSNSVILNIKELTEVIAYPNPLIGDKINLSMNNLEAGKYVLIITNQLGQKINQVSINHSGTKEVQTVTIGKLAGGNYTVSIYSDKYKLVSRLKLVAADK